MLDQQLSVLFFTIALGLGIGRLEYRNLSLGSSGVIFVALGMGHLGYSCSAFVGDLGLVLFVFCLGIGTGPSFLPILQRHGKRLVVVAILIVGLGAATTWLLARMFHIPVDLAVGLFGGSMTSTPALAAALEASPVESQVAVGFGLAYPFGVLGVVFFVQLLPALLRVNLDQLGQQDPKGVYGVPITHTIVEVLNPAIVGRRLSSLDILTEANCQVSRVLHGNLFQPIPADFTLQLGQKLLVVGTPEETRQVVEVLGRQCEQTDTILDTVRQRMTVVVSREVVGKSLAELKLLSRFGVTIARVNRHDFEFVPRGSDVLELGDAVTAVGEPEGLQRFAAFAGHRERLFFETDLVSITVGLLLGIMLGSIEIQLAGYTLALGLAGGPLLVGLILGHFGRIGPLVGHIPKASRLLLTELGLVFFLASSGMRAGGDLWLVLQQHGATLALAAIIITAVPMLGGFLLAYSVMHLNLLQVLGGVCGGMTSTPGLGVITSRTDSEIPVVSYAAVYPVALVLLTILAKGLVLSLSGLTAPEVT